MRLHAIFTCFTTGTDARLSPKEREFCKLSQQGCDRDKTDTEAGMGKVSLH